MSIINKYLRTVARSGQEADTFTSLSSLSTFMIGITGSDNYFIYSQGGVEFGGSLSFAITGSFTGNITFQTDPLDIGLVSSWRRSSGGGDVVSVANNGGSTMGTLLFDKLKIGSDVAGGGTIAAGTLSTGGVSLLRITNCIIVVKSNVYLLNGGLDGLPAIEIVNNMFIRTNAGGDTSSIRIYSATTASLVFANNTIESYYNGASTLLLVQDSGYTGSIYFKSNCIKNFGSALPVSLVFSDFTNASVTSGAETYALSDGDVLGISLNGTLQNLTFHTADFSDISAATAAEVIAVINRDITNVIASGSGSVVITHRIPGTTQTLQISDGTGNPNAAFGFSTDLVTGSGNVSSDLSNKFTNPQTTTQMIQGSSDSVATILGRDFSIGAASPCRDAADPTYAPATDIFGTSRS